MKQQIGKLKPTKLKYTSPVFYPNSNTSDPLTLILLQPECTGLVSYLCVWMDGSAFVDVIS